MSFDGFMMYHLINEYRQQIIPSKLEGVFFEHPDRFIFHLYNGQKYQLIIDLNAQGNKLFYEQKRMKPNMSHPFLNTLKKHLIRASVKHLSQHSTDRVLMFDIDTFDPFDGKKTYQLVFEAMGKHANLILVKDNIIVDAYKKVVSSEHRSVYPNVPFVFFPSQKISFLKMTTPSNNAKEIQQTYEGISPHTATYLAQTLSLPINVRISPTLIKNRMSLFEFKDAQSFHSINELMQQELTQPQSFKTELLIITKALQKKKQKQGHLITDYDTHKGRLVLKEHAEILLTFPHQQEKHHKLFDIPLDETKTVIENINDMFDKYKKALRALDEIKHQQHLNSGEINILEQLIYDIKQQSISHVDVKQCMIDLKLIKPKKEQQKHQKIMYKHIKKETFDIFYGTNAVQNNYVTHNIASSNDYFIHVKDAPGAHVIYRGDKNDPGFRVALQLAAHFSKLKYSSSIPVNITLKKNVKKIPGLYGSYVKLSTYETKFIDIDDDFVNMWDIM